MAGTIEIHPSENSNWRRHKNACPLYRERWFPCNDAAAGEPMYQVFCMQDTPPVNWEEQDRCMHSKNGCWRQTAEQKAAPKETASKRHADHSASSASL